MTVYTVREIFYTLQGEGQRTGRPAVFLRFAGCNLWSGTEAGRAHGRGGCAAWCDTDFRGAGPEGGRYASAEHLAVAVADRWPVGVPGQRYVVCTGGEPALQLDRAAVDALHAVGFEVAIETNGTRPLPAGIDWVCVSPKAGNLDLEVCSGNELKLVYPQPGVDPARFEHLLFEHFLIQPLDTGDPVANAANVEAAIEYCLARPCWALSLQTHKMIGVR